MSVEPNQVAPGWMIIDRHRSEGSEHQHLYEDKAPMQHRGHDQDVTNLVAFIASSLAAFITGAFIPVSGGTVMSAI